MPTDPPPVTETAAHRFHAIETWPESEIMAALIEGQMAAIATLAAARAALLEAQVAALPRLTRGGRLVYAGAGTSGRLAALDAAELEPTFGWPRDRALVAMAGGPAALRHAIEGAEDDAEAGKGVVAELGVNADDVVIALAASGRTPFTCAVAEAARTAGALTIGIANSPGSRLAALAEVGVELLTGAEPVAGSTRMKAGTAQKAALTCLSTGIMLGLGRVWRGRMIGMRPTNAKLQTRALAMIRDLTQHPEPEAEAALSAAGGRIDVAVLMLLRGLDAAAAAARLETAGGRLGVALDPPG